MKRALVLVVLLFAFVCFHMGTGSDLVESPSMLEDTGMECTEDADILTYEAATSMGNLLGAFSMLRTEVSVTTGKEKVVFEGTRSMGYNSSPIGEDLCNLQLYLEESVGSLVARNTNVLLFMNKEGPGRLVASMHEYPLAIKMYKGDTVQPLYVYLVT